MSLSAPPTITDLISPQGEWSIDELLTEWRALEARLQPSADARVSAHLDARGVRYYQTIHLLPKPRRYDGRRAIYGAEHLVRLVCIRALQGQGRSLSEVQRILEHSGEGRLWGIATSALGASLPSQLTHDEGGAPSAPLTPVNDHSTPTPRPLLEYVLKPGVVLMIDPELILDPDALAEALLTHMKVTKGE